MIRLSRPRHLAAAILLLATASCEVSHRCTAIGCLDGLALNIDGSFEPGMTYTIDVSSVDDPSTPVPVISCTYTPVPPGQSGVQLSCQSSGSHTEFGNAINIHDNTLKKVRVIVSSGGVSLSTHIFDVNYTPREINGPGCGTCTNASINVTTS